MAERKVLNKYIPPNFNPNSLVRQPGDAAPRKKSDQKKVRLMAPFSMQCNTCGEFIYKGKKFNARKEDAADEFYLGIKIFRFYIRCPVCASEITFKTDPKNTDYVAEHGAQRNFEPWREETRAHEAVRAERKEKEENNALLALENRTLDSKREMDILDALDEMLTKNAQMEKVDPEKVLEKIHGSVDIAKTLTEIERLQEEEDERIAKSIFTDADGEMIKRISESDEFQLNGNNAGSSSGTAVAGPSSVNVKVSKPTAAGLGASLGIKRKAPSEPTLPSSNLSKKPLIAVDYASDSD